MENKSRNFTHRDIVEMLLQKEGITEGFWSLGINFALSPINARNSDEPDSVYPSMVVSVAGFVLNKESSDAAGVVVDASKLSAPKRKKKTTAAKSS